MNIDFFKPIVGDMSPLGAYSVHGKMFYNKLEAVKYASKHGTPDVKFHWYDSVWETYDRNRLGKQSLDALYLERARQLRDKYNYLILSYSGGSDSHNILMTFLNNNIKLDQIYVNFPFKYINSSLHTPNTIDVRPGNIYSEWEFCVKPVLQSLQKTNPEIVVELGDWTENMTKDFLVEDTFHKVSQSWHAGAMARNLNYSKIGTKIVDSGKNVATIFGVEKPIIGVDNNHVYMAFLDPLHLCTNSVGTFEPFYWTPDLPDLPYEMAYQVYLYYKANPDKQHFILSKERLKSSDRRMLMHVNGAISTQVCYTTWNNKKFQAEKNGPETMAHDVIHSIPEFKDEVEQWDYLYKGFLDDVDPKYRNIRNGIPGGLRYIRSKGFYLGDL